MIAAHTERGFAGLFGMLNKCIVSSPCELLT